MLQGMIHQLTNELQYVRAERERLELELREERGRTRKEMAEMRREHGGREAKLMNLLDNLTGILSKK